MSANQWSTHFKKMAMGTLPSGSRHIVRNRGGGPTRTYFKVVPPIVVSPAQQAVNQAKAQVKVVNRQKKGLRGGAKPQTTKSRSKSRSKSKLRPKSKSRVKAGAKPRGRGPKSKARVKAGRGPKSKSRVKASRGQKPRVHAFSDSLS